MRCNQIQDFISNSKACSQLHVYQNLPTKRQCAHGDNFENNETKSQWMNLKHFEHKREWILDRNFQIKFLNNKLDNQAYEMLALSDANFIWNNKNLRLKFCNKRIVTTTCQIKSDVAKRQNF